MTIKLISKILGAHNIPHYIRDGRIFADPSRTGYPTSYYEVRSLTTARLIIRRAAATAAQSSPLGRKRPAVWRG